MRVRFAHAEGLHAAGQPPVRGFAVAGADRRWHWAEGFIQGDTVLVTCTAVAAPVAVRYAWSDNPQATLRNADGLPARPFRSDDWPLCTAGRA